MKVDPNMFGLEIFICDKVDMQNKDFKQVYKRNLLNPFNLFLCLKKYL